MGGSGGGWNWPRINIDQRIESVNNETDVAKFESEICDLLADYLRDFNNRDVVTVRERLDKIKELIADHIQEAVEQNFGGSVAKHTYVDGLSDIDALIILNGTELVNSPDAAKKTIADALRQRLSSGCEVKTGQLAITVTYSDGMEIQLLPALKKSDGGLKIQSSRRLDAWSNISPMEFQQALTRRNQECNGKLVPTIKLVKAINGTFPETSQLSGYHIESLAISVFRNYQGPKNTAAMVREFFQKATDLVKQPIKDRTGQSIHVDDYMGGSGSAERQYASQMLSRVHKRMQNAVASRDLDGWSDLFEGNQ